MSKKRLADLVKYDSPDAVLEEILYVLGLILPRMDHSNLVSAYTITVDLYEGRFPGYQACNTEYHDLRHTTDTALAMARLLHGASEAGHRFNEKHLNISLVAALFHDAGYILEIGDNQGTGAKHTADHVERGMQFLPLIQAEIGLDDQGVTDCQHMLLCTDLPVNIKEIPFSNQTISFLGKLLGVADLYAQMADRTYLEKLKYLYAEFDEGNIPGFDSESDLLQKTVGFYDFIENRIKNDLDGVNRFLLPHFKKRWGIDEDLYEVSIYNQKNYLIKILNEKNPEDVFSHFKRQVVRVEKKE